MVITSLKSFKAYIKKLTDSELVEVDNQLRSELARKTSPSYKLGHQMMIEEIYIEQKLRELPSDEIEISDDELFQELGI